MPSRSTAIQFGKFLAVGALNTMIDFGMLKFLSWLTGIYGGLRLAPINVLGMLSALTNSYLLNKHWTFKAPAQPGRRASYDRRQRSFDGFSDTPRA
jgi:putative flippase GtrA